MDSKLYCSNREKVIYCLYSTRLVNVWQAKTKDMVIIYSAAYVVRKKNIIRHMNNVFKSTVENLSQLAVTDKVKSHILNTQG